MALLQTYGVVQFLGYIIEDNTIDEICRTLNVSRATLYRYIKTKAAEK
jgi:predicted transcriptional regulator YheO